MSDYSAWSMWLGAIPAFALGFYIATQKERTVVARKFLAAKWDSLDSISEFALWLTRR